MARTINLLLYQIGWFACVLGASYSHLWLGISLAVAMVAIHIWLAQDRIAQIKIMALSAAIGFLVDGLLLNLGVYQFPNGMYVAWLPPLWMTVLWIQFATTLCYSLNWLSGRYALAAGFGFFGAPLAFLAGERIGAIAFLSPRSTNLAILAILWCIAIPLLIYLADRISAHSDQAPKYRQVRPRYASLT